MNTELMIKVRDHIVAHPEQHDQATWAEKTECGTTACVAGWALILGSPVDAHIFDETGSLPPTVAEDAQEILGLTYGQQGALFIGAITHEGAIAGMNALIESNGEIDALDLNRLIEKADMNATSSIT